MSRMDGRTQKLLRAWREGETSTAPLAAREDLRAVAEYAARLEAEVARLRAVLEGVDYELSKALDGTGPSATVEGIRRVLRDARPVPRPSD